MAASVSAIGDGLATALATISGLRTYSYQPEQLNVPFAYVNLDSINYHMAFNGGNVVTTWSVVLVVARWTDRNANAALDAYVSYSGASSVRAAIEADKTLGGICQTLIVNSSADVTSLNSADAEFLEVQFKVEVYG